MKSPERMRKMKKMALLLAACLVFSGCMALSDDEKEDGPNNQSSVYDEQPQKKDDISRSDESVSVTDEQPSACDEQSQTENDIERSEERASTTDRLWPAYDDQTQKGGYINRSGEWVVPPKFDAVPDTRILGLMHENGFSILPVKVNGKWGYVDRAGEWRVDPQFGDASFLVNGMAHVFSAEGEDIDFWFIDSEGNPVPEEKSGVFFFSEGLALRGDPNTGKYGYIDAEGEWVIEPQFSIYPPAYADMHSYDFSSGMAIYTEPREYNLINQAIFDYGKVYINAATTINRKYGFINRKGQTVIPAKYEYVSRFHEGADVVLDIEKYGYMDVKGDWLIEPQYDSAGDYSEGYAVVKSNGVWSFIDAEGKTTAVLEQGSYPSTSFSDGLIAVHDVHGLSGYMNSKGEWVIPAQFTSIGTFYDGLASVEIEEEGTTICGYINTSGEMVHQWRKAEQDTSWK